MSENKTGLIYKKMALVMKDIGSVGKDQKNSAQGYKFRGIDDLINALNPALIKNEVFMTTKVLHFKTELKDVIRSSGKTGVDKHVELIMEYSFHAEDGSSVSSTVAAEGIDGGDKSVNKSLSAALKYALIQSFCVPTVNVLDEADKDTIEIGTQAKSSSQEVSDASSAPPPPKKASSFRAKKQALAPVDGETALHAGADEGWN